MKYLRADIEHGYLIVTVSEDVRIPDHATGGEEGLQWNQSVPKEVNYEEEDRLALGVQKIAQAADQEVTCQVRHNRPSQLRIKLPPKEKMLLSQAIGFIQSSFQG